MMYDVVKKVYDIIKEKREQEKHVSELGNHVAFYLEVRISCLSTFGITFVAQAIYWWR